MTSKSAFWQGFQAGLPFVLIVCPFGLLFGVVATEAGLELRETMAMTALVIAGASQFTALQLMAEQAPTFVVIGAALAVNMRMAMYSASMAPHIGGAPVWQRAIAAYFLVDQTYAASIQKYQDHPDMTLRIKMIYFFGVVTPICPLWYVFTYIGAVSGSTIPESFALDFAVPITFIALVAPALRSLPHIAAAFVSVVVALALSWIPFSLGLIVAAALAMVTGAEVEKWKERRS